MTVLVPRPLRRLAAPTPGSSPAAGHWRIAAGPRLREFAEVAHALIAPHCPGLLPGIDTAAEHAGAADAPSPRSIRFTLADADEASYLSQLPAAIGIDPTGADTACSGPDAESFRLAVSPAGIACAAFAPRGLMRAAAAVSQLLGVGGDLAHEVLYDAPRYAWRGLMLDPARSFIELADLRRLIDLAALYRLNVLHLHLTDDEAWRIEVPGRPRLTGPAQSNKSACSYSLAEFRELQAYAAARYVTVVPEVDLPGHCGAARRAYPALGTVPPPASVPPELAAVLPRPLDPDDALSARFIDEVYTAVSDATQGPYVHIGGDEVFGMPADAFAQAVRRARAAVRTAGRRPVGWQEAARAGAGPSDVSQFWVDTRMADLPVDRAAYAARPEFAAAGLSLPIVHRLAAHFQAADGDLARAVADGGSVLLSPQSHLYLDRPYDPAEVPEPQRDRLRSLGFPTYRPQSVRDAADWDPAVHGVAPERIAGIEATLFGSRLRGFADLSTMLLPRLPGVAEVAWGGSPAPWPGHRDRLAAHAALWQQRDLPFFRSIRKSPAPLFKTDH